MTKKSQKPAPTGKWEMPNKDLLAALGAFVLGWSGLEATIEVCIHKQTGLPPLESSIMTAGLMFKSRSSILSSLLHRDPDRNAKAIAILQEIQNITDRNDIMHGVTGGHQNLIWFNRRRVNSEFRSKFEHYEMRRLFDLALKCGDLSTQLLQALGIPSEEYAKFFQEAHNSANRP